MDTLEMNDDDENNSNNILLLEIPTTGTIPNKSHVNFKLLLRPGLYILIQKAVLLNTCYIVRKCLAE